MTMSKHLNGSKEDVTEVPRAARIVIVLGRSKNVELKPYVDRAWRERVPLVIINLGFPLTPSQQRCVDAALEAAATGAIALDAMIAYDARQAIAFFQRNDDLVFAASRAERRAIEKAREPG
jgi:hypothetical protein